MPVCAVISAAASSKAGCKLAAAAINGLSVAEEVHGIKDAMNEDTHARLFISCSRYSHSDITLKSIAAQGAQLSEPQPMIS